MQSSQEFKVSLFRHTVHMPIFSQLFRKSFHRLNEVWVSHGEGAVPRERPGPPHLPCLLWDAVCPGGGEGSTLAGDFEKVST